MTDFSDPSTDALTERRSWPHCRTCKFFMPDRPEQQDTRGACRRFPPLFTLNDQPIWPVVYGWSWCGEWKNSEQ
jgi:hypothetical protein